MIYLNRGWKAQLVRSAFLVVSCSAGASLYADLVIQSPIGFGWTGPYIGGYVGGAWDTSDLQTSVGSAVNPYFSESSDIASVSQSGINSTNSNSAIAGIELGDDFAISRRATLGFVMDYGSFHLNQSQAANNLSYPSDTGSYSLAHSIGTNWLYTVRGRFAFTPSTLWPLMLYATGGLAVTNVKVSTTFSDTSSLSGEGESSSSSNQLGWILGAGVEVPLIQHLTLNAEYLYVDLGTVDDNSSIQNSAGGFGNEAGSLTSPLETSVKLHASLFKLGLDYKF